MWGEWGRMEKHWRVPGKTGGLTGMILVHPFFTCACVFPSKACHIEGGSAGLIPSQLLEEKRKAFVKRDLELATTGTPLRGTQQSREAPLIMQIRHRLLAAQTHRQQRQHLFPSISYKRFIWCRAAHPPLTPPVCYSRR